MKTTEGQVNVTPLPALAEAAPIFVGASRLPLSEQSRCQISGFSPKRVFEDGDGDDRVTVLRNGNHGDSRDMLPPTADTSRITRP